MSPNFRIWDKRIDQQRIITAPLNSSLPYNISYPSLAPIFPPYIGKRLREELLFYL